MLAKEWLEKRPSSRRESAREAWAMKVIESTLWTIGARKAAADWAWEVGSELMSLGEWDEALDSS